MQKSLIMILATVVGIGTYFRPPKLLESVVNKIPNIYLWACFGTMIILVRNWLNSDPPRIDPSEKAVLITGCDSGFGFHLAKRLDDFGFVVFAGCLAPDRDGAQALKKSTSGRLHVLQLDVTDDWQVQQSLANVTQNLNGRDLWAVVNNAGMGLVAEVEWTSVDQFQRILDVNVLGVVRVTKAFLPLLRHSKGRVINVASLAGRLTLPMYAAYSMSKKAVIAFSDALRQEMAKFDVHVITIEPTLYKTSIAIADPYIDANRRSWSETPTEVKEDYGEEYFDACMAKIQASMDNARPQVEEVITQMELAVCSASPKCRYVPNIATYLRSEILGHLPTSVTDKVFASTTPSLKPLLIQRQESNKRS